MYTLRNKVGGEIAETFPKIVLATGIFRECLTLVNRTNNPPGSLNSYDLKIHDHPIIGITSLSAVVINHEYCVASFACTWYSFMISYNAKAQIQVRFSNHIDADELILVSNYIHHELYCVGHGSADYIDCVLNGECTFNSGSSRSYRVGGCCCDFQC